MAFFVCGINYKTAPITVREHIAQRINTSENNIIKFCDSQIQEMLILSTCNRTEFYVEADNKQNLLDGLNDLLKTTINPEHLYCHEAYEAVHHALRVASGIDSMMVGEPQILGQMKQAYTLSEERGFIKTQLRLIFPFIFSATKRIRHQSGIGRNPVSVASAAAQLINQIFNDVNSINTLIIGTGEMATLVTKYLQKQNAHTFAVASRTLESATILANVLHAPSLTISEIPEYLEKVDLMVTATACPIPFIHKSMVEQALTKRPHQPLVILDLALPRNVESDVSALQQVSLFNIDDLHATIESSLHKREKAAFMAEELAQIELENYIQWHRSLKANDIICDFRTQMQDLAQSELQRAKQKLNNGYCQYTVLSEFCERLVNKLTHLPTVGLKQAASDNRHELLELAQYLFTSSLGTITHEKIS